MTTLFLVSDRVSTPVESRDQLVAGFRTAGKPRQAWRVGTEYEMPGVRAAGPAIGEAPPYEGEAGIGAVFAGFAARRWTEVREEDHVIALTCADAQVTFEPGGQLEHAMRPLATSAELEAEIARNRTRLAEISRPLGLAWLNVGFRPFGTLADVPWMPKQRYAIMRRYLPTRARLPLEMMGRTSTVQANLDFADADDAKAKMRCVQSVTSILTALWANSPIVDEALTGFQSYRANIWLETDPDRCGLLPFLHQDGDVFEAYTDWALDVPMFFVHRGGYHLADGMTFRRFMREGLAGARATIDDWGLHLSTLFPEVRLKSYLEIRGCDVGSEAMMLALGALSRGILHDETACREATGLTAGLDFAARLALRDEVPRAGLAARVGGATLGELARALVEIADDGLGRVAPDERPYLAPLVEIAATGRTQADAVAGAWKAAAGDRAKLIAALAYPGLDGR